MSRSCCLAVVVVLAYALGARSQNDDLREEARRFLQQKSARTALQRVLSKSDVYGVAQADLVKAIRDDLAGHRAPETGIGLVRVRQKKSFAEVFDRALRLAADPLDPGGKA